MLRQYDLRSLIQVKELYPNKTQAVAEEIIRRLEAGDIIENSMTLDDISTEDLTAALCKRMEPLSVSACEEVFYAVAERTSTATLIATGLEQICLHYTVREFIEDVLVKFMDNKGRKLDTDDLMNMITAIANWGI